MTDDDTLIHEAAVLAGVILEEELLSEGASKTASLLLREMRAETECARLVRRIARQFLSSEPPATERL